MNFPVFGTIEKRGNYWIVSCDSHVRIKLRRLFPQVSQNAGEEIRISVSNENSRDLLWFLDRYPMTMKPSDRKSLVQGSKTHIEEERSVNALLEGYQPPGEFALSIDPREYQSIAASLAMTRKGLLIADDVGLGKTVEGICPMAHPSNLPALVVTLTHLPKQWKEEIGRFAPWLSVHILKSGKPYNLEKSNGGKFPDVIISNYHKLHGWYELLSGLVRYVVFDEIQEIRRPGSLKASASRFISEKASLRIGLSATPIYNYGGEFFNILDTLRPGAIGTSEEFFREWCRTTGSGTTEKKILKDPKAFGEYLRREGLMIRRTRTDVGRELPPLSKIPQYVESDAEVLDRIRGSASELARIILANNEEHRGQKMQATEEFNVLMRQTTGIAKAPFVAEFVRLLIENGEKVVLYGWHREVYSIWMEALKEFNPCLYTGTETITQKESAKNAFVNGDCQVLIISLRAGAGLDGLQFVSKTVVFGELDWSPGVHEQCVGRVYRDGQKYPVMAWYLVSDHGVDPIISNVLGLKKSQIESVRDPGASLVEALQVEEGRIRKLAESYLERVGSVSDDP